VPEYKELTKQENMICERWLLYKPDKEKAYQQAREQVLESSPSTSMVDISAIVPGEISDSTGNRGAKLASLQAVEDWLDLINDFESSLPRERQIYLRLRREYRDCRGRKGWTSAVQYRFDNEIRRQIGPHHDGLITRRTMTNWWAEMVLELAREALRRGLL